MILYQSYLQCIKKGLLLLPVTLFVISQSSPIANIVLAVSILAFVHLLLLPFGWFFENVFLQKDKLTSASSFGLFILLVGIAFLFSVKFCVYAIIYATLNFLYYYPKIAINKKAIGAFIFQFITNGLLFYATIEEAVMPDKSSGIAMQASALFVCAFYCFGLVLYKNEDLRLNIETLATKMGNLRTINFGIILMSAGMLLLLMHLHKTNHLLHFFIFLLFLAPVAAYIRWWKKQGIANEIVFESKYTILLFYLMGISFSIFSIVLLIMNY